MLAIFIAIAAVWKMFICTLNSFDLQEVVIVVVVPDVDQSRKIL